MWVPKTAMGWTFRKIARKLCPSGCPSGSDPEDADEEVVDGLGGRGLEQDGELEANGDRPESFENLCEEGQIPPCDDDDKGSLLAPV